MSDETNRELTQEPVDSQTDLGNDSVGGQKPSFLQDETQTSEGTTEQSASEETEVTIPEKFQGKSVEDIVKSYSELESLQGKHATKLSQTLAEKAKLEEEKQHLSELLQTMRQQSQQSSQISDKGAEEEVDLNEVFLERGADVTKQIVRDVIGEVLSERDKKQIAEQERFVQQRDKEIEHVATAELQVIASEIGGEIPPAVLNQISYLDRTDPELDRLRNDPTLTPDRVREETRKLYQRAISDIQAVAGKAGETPSPEQLEAFNNAQKRAASSTPSDSAKGSQAAPKSDPRIEMMKKAGWGFLAERS